MNTTITTVSVSDPALQEACDAIGRDTVIRLAQELTSARRKYPGFALNHAEAVDVVESEFLEWKAQAMRASIDNVVAWSQNETPGQMQLPFFERSIPSCQSEYGLCE